MSTARSSAVPVTSTSWMPTISPTSTVNADAAVAARSRSRAAGSAGLRRALTAEPGSDLRLQVILQADPVDQLELRLEPVDVILLGVEDALEQVAAHVVLHGLAMRNGLAQRRHRLLLELEVALEHFLDVLADHEPA